MPNDQGTVGAADAAKLPPLRIQVTRDGKPERVIEVADPREDICRSYNRYGGPLLAVPVVES